MAEISTKMCRICLATSKDVSISDSSCYAKFFIHVMALKELKKTLWLCVWCKASLKRAVALFTLALESEKAQHLEVDTDFFNASKHIYNMKYVCCPNIDIPPIDLIETPELNKPIVINIDELNVSVDDETEIPLENDLKLMENGIKDTKNIDNQNDDIINEFDIPHEKELKLIKNGIEDSNNIDEFEVENENEINRSKKISNFNELKYEVHYLNLEEQLKDVEIKRVKYKDFKFQCNECGLGFLTGDVFEEHRVRHSQVAGPHTCNICSLRFKSQDVFSQHVLAHRRRFKCLLCNAVFNRWQHCVVHRYKCGAIVEPIACGQCSKIFNNELLLKFHMKVHEREKKYCCDQCDKKFPSKQRLVVHKRSHTGIKPYTCQICNRSFTTASYLRAHSSVHSDVSVHYCVECHTYYKSAKSLRRHFNESARHMSSNSAVYACKECSKQFPTEKCLRYHVNARHITEHRCTLCHKTFSNNSNLNKHMKCIHTAK